MKYLDTYALWEIKIGNNKFANYFNEEFIINQLTLAEFYGVILRKDGELEADKWYNKLLAFTEPVSLQQLINAVKFKAKNAKKELSFFDAVGYIFAKENNWEFVTGDKEFEGMEGVEFVKK